MPIISVLFLVFLTSCARDIVQDLPSREGMPDQESWGVIIILTDEGTIRAKVRSGHLEKYNEKEFVMLDSSVTAVSYTHLTLPTILLV